MAHESTLDTESVDLAAVARRVVDEFAAAPCAVVGGAQLGDNAPGGRMAWRFAWGAAGALWTTPPRGVSTPAPSCTTNHIFDLASLTKPAVALTLARLERRNVLDREEPLSAFLHELADTPSGGVSLDLLSAHRAGLVAHLPFFVAEAGAQQPPKEEVLRRAAQARRDDCTGTPPPEGFPPIYSDLGYMLVGEAMARRAKLDLDQLVVEEVTRPLGLTMGSMRYLARHEPMAKRRIVPTEDVPWRGGVVNGVVHDENAWILADQGMAGHAGLFGDVWSVVRLGTAILDAWSGRKTAWLDPERIAPLVRERPGGSHAAGFDRRSGDNPSSGQRFGPATVGHLGFTGTSLWLDPEATRVGVLLTNRVHPSRDHIAIRAARPAVYDDLVAALSV